MGTLDEELVEALKQRKQQQSEEENAENSEGDGTLAFKSLEGTIENVVDQIKNALDKSEPDPVACTVQVKKHYLRAYKQPEANYIDAIEPDYLQALMNYQIRAVMNYDPVTRRVVIGPDDGMLMPQVLSLVTEAKSSAALEEFKTGIGIIVHTEDDHLSSNPSDTIDNIYPMGQSFLAVSNFTKDAKLPQDEPNCKGKEILFITKDGYEFCMDPSQICKYYEKLNASSEGWKIFSKQMLIELGCTDKQPSNARDPKGGGSDKGNSDGTGQFNLYDALAAIRKYMARLQQFKTGEVTAEQLAYELGILESMGIKIVSVIKGREGGPFFFDPVGNEISLEAGG